MAKKLLCALVLILAFVCVFISCDNGDSTPAHTHSYSEWVTIGDCIAATKERTCTECGAKESINTYSRGYHEFNWVTTKEPTCTVDGAKEGTCECGAIKTETIIASHNYEKGICTKCNCGLLNIILPEIPITVNYRMASGSKLVTTGIMSDLKISEIEENYEGTYSITFLWSGEKTLVIKETLILQELFLVIKYTIQKDM